MSKEIFDQQILRLQVTYGDKAYSIERQKLLWRTFSNERDDVFVQCIDNLILTCRSTPLHEEFHNAMTAARRACDAVRFGPPVGTGDIMSAMREMESLQVGDNEREFARACNAHLQKYLSGGMTRAVFLEGCDFFDKLAAQNARTRRTAKN
jgi:hypothetical protein